MTETPRRIRRSASTRRRTESDSQPSSTGIRLPELVAVLLCGSSPAREELRVLLTARGFSVRVAETTQEAQEQLKDGIPCLVLVDLRLPSGGGLPYFRELRQRANQQAVLIVDGNAVEDVTASLEFGTRERIISPFTEAELSQFVDHLRANARFKGEIGLLKLGLLSCGRFGSLVGTSPVMQQVYDLICRAARCDATVLLTGESGTGKELVARTIHDLSARSRKPFLAMNCGAALPGMVDNELFGHAKGSFTGADRVHSGIFERAQGGTLMLDEIADMPTELQVKLLRTLETRTILKVGGDRETAVDVRIIAATNRTPEDAVAEDRLREDLYYRLRVLRIRLPPLRERRGDVPLLAREFLAELNRGAGEAKSMTPAAVELLDAQPWWGNVRELRNTMQEAFILADHVIDAPSLKGLLADWSDSPPRPAIQPVSGALSASPAPAQDFERSLRPLVPGECTLAAVERKVILATLAACGGNKTMTARVLGINPKTLYTRLLGYAAENGTP